jgi:hypothetical protein
MGQYRIKNKTKGKEFLTDLVYRTTQVKKAKERLNIDPTALFKKYYLVF